MATTNRSLRLSKRLIDALPASMSKETEYTDTDVSGLKLVVTFPFRHITDTSNCWHGRMFPHC